MTAEVYMDYAATTPLDSRVRDRMFRSMGSADGFGNPASNHVFGTEAAGQIDEAAAEVAELLKARPEEIVWTSGATESDNLAIIGAAQFRTLRGKHIVTTAIEHKAVLESCAWLERNGFEVTYVQPDAMGMVDPLRVAAEIRGDTTLVSVMHANNETGVIQKVADIGSLCRARDVLFHVDAAQTVGKLPIDLRADNIDLLSINAHKACGPKGIGALVLNADTIRRIEPLMFGGGQQRGIRPGTLAVHQIVGMGETMRILGERGNVAEVARVRALRDRLWSGIRDVPGVSLNGHPEHRLCSILNVSVADVEGESLRLGLGNLAVASGSACNSATGEPSYVLRSLGLNDQLVEASLRFSLGRFSTESEVDQAIELFCDTANHLRQLSPRHQAG